MTTTAMRIWFGVFVALVFAAGVATGLVVAPRLFLPEGGPFTPVGPGFGPGPGMRPGASMPAPLVRRLAGELQLDEAQQQKLEAVFERRRERLQTFNREVRERFETEQRDLRSEIAEILTPEQQKRFDEWLLRPPRRGPRGPERRFF